MTRNTDTVFRAAEPDKLEGVAGQAWARNAIVSIANLPDLESIGNQDQELQAKLIEEYAAGTSVTTEWVRKRLKAKRPMARSFCGLPVECNGTMWGVLVIDSRNPEAKTPEFDPHFRFVAGLLGKILSK